MVVVMMVLLNAQVEWINAIHRAFTSEGGQLKPIHLRSPMLTTDFVVCERKIQTKCIFPLQHICNKSTSRSSAHPLYYCTCFCAWRHSTGSNLFLWWLRPAWQRIVSLVLTCRPYCCSMNSCLAQLCIRPPYRCISPCYLHVRSPFRNNLVQPCLEVILLQGRLRSENP